MSVLKSKLNARATEFRANADAMRAQVDDLRERVRQVGRGGGEAARQRHMDRGKLLPRVRVQMLLDPGTPFLEVAPLTSTMAQWGQVFHCCINCFRGRRSPS